MELITSIHNEKIKNITHLLQRGRGTRTPEFNCG